MGIWVKSTKTLSVGESVNVSKPSGARILKTVYASSANLVSTQFTTDAGKNEIPKAVDTDIRGMFPINQGVKGASIDFIALGPAVAAEAMDVWSEWE